MDSPIAVVTGASGFVGRALTARLVHEGVHVRAITRSADYTFPSVQVSRVDIRDSNALLPVFRDADVVFHLAAHTHDLRSTDDSGPQQAITLGGTIAALEAAERAGVPHFVFASSLAVFGNVGNVAASEEHVCRPQTPYGRAKLESEEAVRAFAHRTGASAASIRPAMIYGVGCPGNLPRMIRAIMARRFPPIPEFGNRRSMVFVDDVARAMMLAWTANIREGREYIITDGEAYSTRRLYDLILGALGIEPSRLVVPRRAFDVAARVGDWVGTVAGRRMPFDSQALERLMGSALFVSDRARRELGFLHTRTLPDVLPSMIQQIRAR